MSNEVKEEYLKLKDTFALPSYDDLDKEFEICEIEKKDYLLSKVRDRITEKIEELVKFIENILQPDTTIGNLFEYKAIGDEERNKIYRIFKKLMRYSREAFEISLDNDEKKNADFIKKFYKDWALIKDETKDIIKLLKKSWDTESDIKEDLSYMG